jgi:hypothetical protein
MELLLEKPSKAKTNSDFLSSLSGGQDKVLKVPHLSQMIRNHFKFITDAVLSI